MPESPADPAQPAQPEPARSGALPARVTMPLLTLVGQQALDEDYETAAESARRRPGPADPDGAGRRPGRRASVVVVALFGLLIAVAAVQTSRDAGVEDAGRAGLISRIEAQRDAVAARQQLVADLRARTVAAETALSELTQDATALDSRVSRLRSLSGLGAVTGPGVRVVLDEREAASPDQRLRDTDLALLVNALWSAGAEAISVNGQRLTALSAIRTSGSAVEINDVGIAPPFTVLATGNTATLQSRFYDSASGLALDDLARRYGFTLTMDNEDRLRLPAAPARLERLRSATPVVGGSAGGPSGTATEEELP